MATPYALDLENFEEFWKRPFIIALHVRARLATGMCHVTIVWLAHMHVKITAPSVRSCRIVNEANAAVGLRGNS